MNENLNKLKDRIVKAVTRKHIELFGEDPKFDKPISISIDTKPDARNSVGMYHFDTGTVHISPRILKNIDYLIIVMTHEICHGALGKMPKGELHNEKFHTLSSAMGIPKKYRD